jgi:hypothetical protein
MTYGVNYLPSSDWWYAWVDWDEVSIARDMDTVAGLGFDHIRIQCLWPVFQPNPAHVSPAMLARLVRLLDLASERGLVVCPTVLDGWLSGFDFRPAWLRDADPFTDPEAVEAAAVLVNTVARTVLGHPALWCLDIANELNVLMRQSGLAPGSGDGWAVRMVAAARAVAPGIPVTIGVDHEPWMTGDCGLTAGAIVAASDLVAIHAWPYFTGALARFGEGERGAWAIPDYLAQDRPRRPQWTPQAAVGAGARRLASVARPPPALRPPPEDSEHGSSDRVVATGSVDGTVATGQRGGIHLLAEAARIPVAGMHDRRTPYEAPRPPRSTHCHQTENHVDTDAAGEPSEVAQSEHAYPSQEQCYQSGHNEYCRQQHKGSDPKREYVEGAVRRGRGHERLLPNVKQQQRSNRQPDAGNEAECHESQPSACPRSPHCRSARPPRSSEVRRPALRSHHRNPLNLVAESAPASAITVPV